MATQRQQSQRFRQRKLSTKQSLHIVRESDIEKTAPDDDAQRHIPKIETGVEKGEEIEHHLQAAISASAAAAVGGKVAQIYIPTPETTLASGFKYDELYPRSFRQPATYIRFSSTVEDCTGAPYCMDGEDEAWLVDLNKEQPKGEQCSEDAFEEVISFFETTSQSRQPFAAVDNAPVLSYPEMESAFDDTISDASRPFAPAIYEYWKMQRLKRAPAKSLMPSLKFETGAETDDSDPYVCFRRREVRQARKTRGRDAQVAEKLRKLRKELEDARQLVNHVKMRERTRRDQLAVDRQIFEQRQSLKEAKRNLGIKGDDEDFVNQKPQPKPKFARPEPIATGRLSGNLSLHLRGPSRPDLRPVEADLVSLEDQKAERERIIRASIDDKIQKHKEWNRGYVDLTWRPLTPPLEDSGSDGGRGGFRAAAVVSEYLPTPPPSVDVDMKDAASSDKLRRPSDQEDVEMQGTDPVSKKDSQHSVAGAPVTPTADDTVQYHEPSPSPLPVLSYDTKIPATTDPSNLPRVRTRLGRLGRRWLDRRPPPATKYHNQGAVAANRKHPVLGPGTSTSTEPEEEDAFIPNLLADRHKYEHESGDEDSDTEGYGAGRDVMYTVDPFSDFNLRCRASLITQHVDKLLSNRRPASAAAAAAGDATTGSQAGGGAGIVPAMAGSRQAETAQR